MSPELITRIQGRVEETKMLTIFLSSPFGGMEGEREVFVEKYVPVLRGVCEKNGVMLKLCDLRWGKVRRYDSP